MKEKRERERVRERTMTDGERGANDASAIESAAFIPSHFYTVSLHVVKTFRCNRSSSVRISFMIQSDGISESLWEMSTGLVINETSMAGCASSS